LRRYCATISSMASIESWCIPYGSVTLTSAAVA